MSRALSLGYRRYMMKYPVAIINDDGYTLNSPIGADEVRKNFANQEIPVTNEGLISLLKFSKKIQKPWKSD